MPSILIVEDDAVLRMTLKRLFAKNNFLVTDAEKTEEAIGLIESDIFDLILTDLRLGNDSGLELLAAAKRLCPETEVIIMTAYGSVESAVKALQEGASDYITKPFKNEQLLFKANRALERAGLRNEIRYLRQEVAQQFGFDNIIGSSRPIAELKKIISQIAQTNIAVLITGESGTGKELVAKVIHHHSDRRHRPFLPINCSAIPENLMESEMFGHVKGAFTSAIANKRGLFEEASKGTIFLDEIGDMPPSIQAKLLRVLQEKEIRPVGGNVTRAVDVRIIAATNSDLTGKIRQGTFRDDLYYRLNVMPLRIPPLRERLEDIPLLTQYFLRRIQKEYNCDRVTISADGLELLLKHEWPGNVRELENTLKRAVALCNKDRIGYEDIIFISPVEQQPQIQNQFAEKVRSLQESQKIQILKTLQENDWNYSMTASQLGIGRTTLWRKVKKFNLKQPVGTG